MNVCSSTCLTKDHKTFGECLRAKGLQISPAVLASRGGAGKAWDAELDHYENAVRQGLSPEGTTRAKVDKAIREADA